MVSFRSSLFDIPLRSKAVVVLIVLQGVFLTALAQKMNLNNATTLRLDSAHHLDSAKHKPALYIDSLKKFLSTPERIAQNVENKIQNSIDTLANKLNQPQKELSEQLAAREAKLQSKLDKLQGEAQAQSEKVTGAINANVNKATEGNFGVPNNLQLPQNTGLPGAIEVGVINKKTDLPDLELSKLKDLPKTNIKVPDISTTTKKISSSLDVNTSAIKESQQKLGQVEGKLDEAKKYVAEIDDIKENGLRDAEKIPDQVEKRVGGIDEIKSLNADKQKLTQYQDVISKYKDKKLLQEEVLRKGKVIANDKLNKFAPIVQEAQSTIGKVKKINPVVQSFKDITKKRTNEMKGKPFRQRFSPGLSFQPCSNDKVTFDISTLASYRLSAQLTSGLAYSYRVSFSDKNPNVIGGEGISGYRFFADFKLVKSIFVHGDIDAMSLDRSRQPTLWETMPTTVYGSFFGLGKYYSVSRRLNGSVMALYRVNYQGQLPGASKVNLRLQLNLDLKKQKKLKL